MHLVLKGVLTALGAVAWLMTPLPVVPAMEILLGLTLLAAAAAGWPGGWTVPVAATALWGATALVEHMVRVHALNRGGARPGSAWAALAGGVLGLIWGQAMGLVAGAFLGAFFWEVAGGRHVEQGGRAGVMAAVAVLGSGLGRLVMGALLYGLLIWTAWGIAPG